MSLFFCGVRDTCYIAENVKGINSNNWFILIDIIFDPGYVIVSTVEIYATKL